MFVVGGWGGGVTLGVGLKWESKANEQIASEILWGEGMYFYRYQLLSLQVINNAK